MVPQLVGAPPNAARRQYRNQYGHWPSGITYLRRPWQSPIACRRYALQPAADVGEVNSNLAGLPPSSIRRAGYCSTRARLKPSFASVTRMSAQLFKIQTAPAWRNSDGRTAVVKPITLAPAAFPDWIPAGASSRTMQSPGGKPRSVAAFEYGSGCGLPVVAAFEVIMRCGNGQPAARRRTPANPPGPEGTMVHPPSRRLAS